MNYYVQRGLIAEVKSQGSTGYIMNRDDIFSPTEYKVLKSHEKGGFIRCSKLMYNGKQKLLYFTADYKSLTSMLPSLDIDGFLTIIANIFKTLIEINNIGFLRCQNIDSSFDKIFVDPNTLSVFMIYLPITADGADKATFNIENDLRTDIIKLVNSHPALSSQKTYKLCQALANGKITTAEIYSFILKECLGRYTDIGNMHDNNGNKNDPYIESQGGGTSGSSSRKQPNPGDGLPLIRLIAKNPADRAEFRITKSPFVLGRSESYADGVITGNKAVGRTHCQIVFKNGCHYAIDMKSANGTAVNGKRLNPEQPYQLSDGDTLRLANIDFIVRR